jgi:hypothetical protein
MHGAAGHRRRRPGQARASRASTALTRDLLWTPECVLRTYFQAKDANRPHLLDGVFTADARLEVHNPTRGIAFPAVTLGREAIADVLVRRFAQTYENVYSFYMARPPAAARAFACDWLVCMSDKESRSVRVGCGRYDWVFQADAPRLAAGLTIDIAAMVALPVTLLDSIMVWSRGLSYPWSNATAVSESAPRIEALAEVLEYLVSGPTRHGQGEIKHYDPDSPVDAASWLALDEQARIELVAAQHRAAHIKLPHPNAHAALHVIVENQIAAGLDAVARAVVRLMHEGLTRHDAVHAIASVTTEQLWEASRSKDEGIAEHAEARYTAAVERLTAKEWRRKYGA